MAQVTITINSREYAVACEDGQELRIIQLAKILDDRARALTGGSQQVNEAMLLALVGLMLADELTESKKSSSTTNPQANQHSEDEKFAERIRKIDESTANQIKSLHEKLNLLASELNLL